VRCAVLLIVLAAGCAQRHTQLYEGPPIADQVTLVAMSSGGGRLLLEDVDGMKPAGLGVYILPGEHTVKAAYSLGAWIFWSQPITFVARPGRTYAVRTNCRPMRSCVFSITEDGPARPLPTF
jgi:hypothetical protein